MSTVFPRPNEPPSQEEWEDFPRRVGLVNALMLGWRPMLKMPKRKFIHTVGPSTYCLGQDILCNFLQHCEHPGSREVTW